MGNRTWTAEQKQFLRDNYGTMSYTDISANLDKPVNHIKSMASNLKITTTRKWPDVDLKLLRNLYPDTPTQEIAKKLKRELQAVYGMATNLGLRKSESFLHGPHSGRLTKDNAEAIGGKSRFQKGQVPWSKGKKIGSHPNSVKTQFQKGRMPHNWVPVGTRVVATMGYLKEKVAEPNVWEFCHKKLWTELKGPVPKHHMIAFRDGDRMNVTIDNLECVSRQEWIKRYTMRNYPEDVQAAIHALAGVKRRLKNYAEKQDRRSKEHPV